MKEEAVLRCKTWNGLMNAMGWDMPDLPEGENFEIQLRQTEDHPDLYEVECQNRYGSWDTIYYWPNSGEPTSLRNSVPEIYQRESWRDREGIYVWLGEEGEEE